MSRSRLDTVLRIRSLQERIARGEIERERAVASQREHDATVAREAVTSRADRAPTSPAAFVAQREMLVVGSEHIGVASATAAAAQLDVAYAVSEWTSTRRRLEGVERLDERLSREVAAADAARDQLELDDLVVTRWKRGDA